MHHRRPAAPHSHRPNHRQINRLMPFTTAPLFHALQLLETGDSARFHMPGHKGEPVFNTYADIFAIDFTETYGTGNLYTGEGPIRDAEVAAARYFGSDDCERVFGENDEMSLDIKYCKLTMVPNSTLMIGDIIASGETLVQ